MAIAIDIGIDIAIDVDIVIIVRMMITWSKVIPSCSSHRHSDSQSRWLVSRNLFDFRM